MIELFDKDSGDRLGEISEEQLQFLIDQLEEESASDQDYYINLPTLMLFEQKGADDELLELLRQAMGERVEMDIVWRRGA